MTIYTAVSSESANKLALRYEEKIELWWDSYHLLEAGSVVATVRSSPMLKPEKDSTPMRQYMPITRAKSLPVGAEELRKNAERRKMTIPAREQAQKTIYRRKSAIQRWNRRTERDEMALWAAIRRWESASSFERLSRSRINRRRWSDLRHISRLLKDTESYRRSMKEDWEEIDSEASWGPRAALRWAISLLLSI